MRMTGRNSECIQLQWFAAMAVVSFEQPILLPHRNLEFIEDLHCGV
jgi:hypothetical protein